MNINNTLARLRPRSQHEYRQRPLLGGILDAFAEWILERGFSSDTGRTDVNALRRLAPWFQRRRKRSVDDLRAEDVVEALRYYRHCQPQWAAGVGKLGQFLQAQPIGHGAEAFYWRVFAPATRLQPPYHPQLSRHLEVAAPVRAGRKRRVADLTVADLSPTTITAFLHHLETVRGNGATTRNVRLSAIHSFFDFFGAQHPEHLAQAQRVLSVPFKRTDHRTIDYLEAEELRAVLEGIDRSTLAGRRDYVLLALLFNTGARIPKAVSLQTTDLRLAAPPTVKFLGKGRKE
jgi:site-specific recombinase XerD